MKRVFIESFLQNYGEELDSTPARNACINPNASPERFPEGKLFGSAKPAVDATAGIFGIPAGPRSPTLQYTLDAKSNLNGNQLNT
jgi:hypothetical protein